MATSNNDRISSRRLLDTLKGLQTSRHLGSEPEVVTETVEYPAEVFPKSGTYTGNDVIAQLGTASFDLEHNLPIKVYGSITSDTDGFVVPDKSGEPLATLNVVSKPSGLTVISDVEVTDEMISNQPITGHYFLMQQGNYWLCFYEIADVTNFNTAHVWETTGYTETTTNKTKHTIKQDYVPNADWNVNDPDTDGYVQGRTHWVEVGETEATVNVQTGVAIGNFATGTCDKFGAVKGFTYPTGEYNPGRTGEIGKIEEYGQTIAFSYIGEDENGNAIVPTNLDELQNALSSTAIGIMLIEEQGASVIVYVVYPNVTSNDVCTATIASETVHKLDRKFYDYTEPFDPEGYTKDSDISIRRRSIPYESSQGPFTHTYDYVRLPNGLAYGNVTLRVDSWDNTTKTGTFSTFGTPLANPGTMIGGTAYINGGIVFFSVEGDGSNPRISNPIPSDLLVASRASMWIPQMFVRKEDE